MSAPDACPSLPSVLRVGHRPARRGVRGARRPSPAPVVGLSAGVGRGQWNLRHFGPQTGCRRAGMARVERVYTLSGSLFARRPTEIHFQLAAGAECVNEGRKKWRRAARYADLDCHVWHSGSTRPHRVLVLSKCGLGRRSDGFFWCDTLDWYPRPRRGASTST